MMTGAVTYSFPPFRLLPAQRQLTGPSGPIRLGGRAFDLLVALVERRDGTVSHDELMHLVWPRLVVEENNLQVQVLTLRKLLGYAAIATVPGRGYRFALPVQVEDGQEARSPAGIVASDRAVLRGNLPQGQPTLHGREAALEALEDLLEHHAWVTVFGPAGIGKTRLAQAAARRRDTVSPGGVWWVDLAGLTDPALVPSAVAQAMHLPPGSAAHVADSLALRTAGTATLLVLDNVEHLADGLPEFITLLRARVAGLRIMLTSQEVLHGADEQVFRVESLSLPQGLSLAAAEASGAVRLFVARAQAVDRRFGLTDDNHAAVAALCRQLDGIPLAIELAAARVQLLGVDGLLQRLDQRFQILTVGDRTGARRHRTLREAVQWSYQLLSEAEQSVFRRLSVFAGGFTLPAAQSVAAVDDEPGMDAWDVLDHLGRLVDKSLVVAEGDPLPRYRLLETLRLFGLERLIEHGEADAARDAHRSFFVGVAEAANLALRSERADGWARLDVERDNLLVAIAWRRGDDPGLEGLRLAEALVPYWSSRGMVSFALDQATLALAHPGGSAHSPLRCRVLLYAAGCCSLTGRLDDAARIAAEALAMARSLNDAASLSFAHALRAQIHDQCEELDAALRHAEQAVAEARLSADSWTLRRALLCLGTVQGRRGRMDLAVTLELEGLALCEVHGWVRLQAEHRLNLAWLHCAQDQADSAALHLREVVAALPWMDSEYYGLGLVRTVAAWTARSARHDPSLQCYAAFEAQALRMGLNEPLEPWEQACRQRAEAALDPDASGRAAQRGRTSTHREAVDQAARLLDG